MNSTPNSDRFCIGIFGKCNTGKSSLINRITNQQIAIVSSKEGTTTDLVKKALELPKIGPSILIDTPGFDDNSDLIGKIRVEKSLETLDIVNAALLVTENNKNLDKIEKNFLEKIKLKKIPFILVINKCDLNKKNNILNTEIDEKCLKINVSTKTKENIDNLINLICENFYEKKNENHLISDLINPLDVVLLIIVMDEAYPKARLILPQQQLINDTLKAGGICFVLKYTEYEQFIKNLKIKPKLIVTDSQIFSKIYKQTPENLLITSFSILLARKKGILKTALEGVKSVKKINAGSKILVCENCTHKKKSCDLGSIKIPKWLEKYTNKKFEFEFLTGCDFTKNIKKYSLIIHCGGCMASEKTIKKRFEIAKENNIPITNYGILIAYLNGVLEKSIYFIEKLKQNNSTEI